MLLSMFGFLSIAFREAFEVVFILTFVFCFIRKTRQLHYRKYIYFGIVAALLLVVVFGIVFSRFISLLQGRAEEVFEGVFMIGAGLFLTYMIVWMHNQQGYIQRLKTSIVRSIEKKKSFDLFFISFISVLREGIEMIVFIETAAAAFRSSYIFSVLAGVVLASGLGFLMYKGVMKMNIKKFFVFSALILVFFTAGIISQGVYELQEADILPVFRENVWRIDPENTAKWVYVFMSEEGYVGSFLKIAIGYDDSPTLLQFGVYTAYIALFLGLFFNRREVKRLIHKTS